MTQERKQAAPRRPRFHGVIAVTQVSCGAWPTISQAAKMIGVPTSTLTRAADVMRITKYPYGGRDKKLAPDSVLDLALHYNADVNEVAELLMVCAEESGKEQDLINEVDEAIGTWLAVQAQKAGDGDVSLDEIIAAVQEIASPEIATAIFSRAGVKV